MTARTVIGVWIGAALFPALASAVETVRVDAASGAPRVVVDGKPVRARVFWGAPGSRPVHVAKAGGRISFEFAAVEDEPAGGTMHVRFGEIPGEVYLHDLRVEDLEDKTDVLPPGTLEQGAGGGGTWTTWPPPEKNTVGTVRPEAGAGPDGTAALHVAIKAPPDGNWPDFHLYTKPALSLKKGHHYRVSFWGRAEPARDLTIAFYRPGAKYVFLGGPPGVFETQIKLAASAGVNIITFPIQVAWPKPGEAEDWASIDALCRSVLDANPDALLIPRISVDAPPWWLDAHPDDVLVWDKGKHDKRWAAVASPDYRHEAARRFAATVEHLEAIFGPHVAGYHPAGQNTDEWFYPDTWGEGLNGYSKADEKAWRGWLAGRYPDAAALRTAWHDEKVAPETAAVPSPAARRAAPAGVLRDPATERSLIDFAEFQQQMMADCVCGLAKAARQASRGKKLVLFFYGYGFEFGLNANGPATSGHYALRQVLSSPDVNVLCSPISYFDRGLGESAPAMSAAESVALAGKMWLEEDDTRTYLGSGNAPGWAEAVDTLEKTNRELLRNTGQCALRNFGTWWMDLGASGWFNDPGMWEQMAKLDALDRPLLDHPTPFTPEVAAVIDERSLWGVAHGGQAVTQPGLYDAHRPLGRTGAPYGQYLLDDVAAGRVRAKEYVFLTAWRMEPAERRRLLDATRGSLRLWCYAPGWQTDHATSTDGMRELTGFRLEQVSGVEARAEPTEAGKKLGLREALGVKRKIEPFFAARDATADETLATYPDGSAAVALRRTNDGASLFVGPPGLSSELLRLAAREAGVHLFTQTDCNVYANGPYLLLHGSRDGELQIDTNRPGPIRDLLTNQPLGAGPKITLTLEKGQTRILAIDSPTKRTP